MFGFDVLSGPIQCRPLANILAVVVLPTPRTPVKIKACASLFNSIALVTLFSGIIVLAGIIDVGKKDKLYEVAILKILGATPKRVAYLWFKEYFIIGLISSVVSLIIGFLVSYVLLNYIFNIEIYFDFKMIFVLSLLVPFLVTTFSLLRMISLLMTKPLVVLRSYF